MANSKHLGIVQVSIDGNFLKVGDGSTLNPGGVNRPVVKGATVYGFREEIMESTLEIEVAIDATYSSDYFRNLVDASIVVVADTGQTWTIQNGWCSEPPPISQKDGKAKVKFMGPPAEEILS